MITDADIEDFKFYIKDCRENGPEEEGRLPFLLRQYMKSYGVIKRRQDIIDAALDVEQFKEICAKVLGHQNSRGKR